MEYVADLLTNEREAILQAAQAALGRTHPSHYETAGPDEVHRRLGALLDHLIDGVARRDLTRTVEYAQQLAEERFAAGYDLTEVQTAFNALEEAAWISVLEHFPPTGYAEALGLISTVLGAGKDALARRYVSLASHTHAPSLDLRALFSGR